MRARIASGRVRPDKPMRSVVSAGGVVFDERGRILLLRKADELIWTFPKGHIEPGETAEQAAAREIEEESGLRCTIGSRVAEIRYAYYWAPDDVNYDKRVIFFLARPAGRDVRLEDRFDAFRWVSPARAGEFLYHHNDKQVLRRAVRLAGVTASGRS